MTSDTLLRTFDPPVSEVTFPAKTRCSQRRDARNKQLWQMTGLEEVQEVDDRRCKDVRLEVAEESKDTR